MAPYLPPKIEEPATRVEDESITNEKCSPPELKWEELGFTLTQTDFMYVMKCSIGETFTEGGITPFRNIELNPASTLLNYGQGLFEGLKAYRREDGKVQIFRPELNALRMKAGAHRLCMPSPSVEQFIDAVKTTVCANLRWVPPSGKGSMYVRPLLMGTGASLGLGPAPEYMFLVYASPVSNYFKVSQPLKFTVEEKHHRAMLGGTGGVKSVGNYSPVLHALCRAKAEGFSDVLFLDAETGKYVEEASAANIFIVKGHVISTPPITHGTILPGITRQSIMELAVMLGYKVEERQVPLEDFINADEVFCTGTAVVVTPVGSVTYKDKEVEFKVQPGEKEKTVCKELHDALTGIQTGRTEDKMGWMVEVKGRDA